MNIHRHLLMACLAGLVLATAPVLAQDEHDHDEDHAPLAIDTATRTEFGIETATAGPAILRDMRTLPGEVRTNGDRVVHLVPRYGGVVTEVRARVGDEVRAGQTLAVVENDASLTTFEVSTALGGTVIERHVGLGEAVSRDQVLFVVADLDTVWIDIAVYLRDLDDVRKGLPVNITCGRHEGGIDASIDYVSPVVDEATRTATARVVLANRNLHWRPGMFVTAHLETRAAEAAVVVPASALFTVEGRTSVFVETEAGFEPRAVTVGRTTEELAEVTAGLVAGEIFVARGGFTLKAELEKASFGDGHNH